MSVFQKEGQGIKYNQASWLVVLRVLLGIVIIAKGYTLLSHNMAHQEILSHTMYGINGSGIVSLLIVSGLTHFVAGTMLIVGLLTKFASAFQIPFTIYTFLFVNMGLSFSVLNTNIWSFSITLILLIVFWFVSPSTYSLDHYLDEDHSQEFA